MRTHEKYEHLKLFKMRDVYLCFKLPSLSFYSSPATANPHSESTLQCHRHRQPSPSKIRHRHYHNRHV